MKKIVASLMALLMAIGFSGCFALSDSSNSSSTTSENIKPKTVGDTIKYKGVSLTVTKVESSQYIDTPLFKNKESKNGSWVKVSFTMENETDQVYTIHTVDFKLNDTYTIREYSYKNIESYSFELIKGNTYDFYMIYDCNYNHNEKDLYFIWEAGYSKKYQWTI